MNKIEVQEIKKLFTMNNSAITRICGCYVNHEKEKVSETKGAFLALPEEEMFKYFEIFKKTLSGSIGKNLIDMEFPLEQEEEGGTQEFLLKLRNSKLKDDALIEEFYDRVIDSFYYVGNYYIILVHEAYDVPGKTSDRFTMEDASDEIYEYILCCICPVGLSKPGLSYNHEKNAISDRLRDWVVDAPVNGFLFPAFNDRSADIHHALLYTKKPDVEQDAFIEKMFGTASPLSADAQKESFHTIVSELLGDDCDYEVVKNIHDHLHEVIEEHKEYPAPLELKKQDLENLFANSGVSNERMENFEKVFNDVLPENASLMAENLTDTKKVSIQTPDIIIKVKPDRSDLVETKIIDGRKCLVIAVDGNVELNGLDVKLMG